MATRRARIGAGSRQKVVDSVFRKCMESDRRTLEEIRAAVKEELNGTSWNGHLPTDHQIQIMISRNCMGEGEWPFYPAYTNPPRYVSRDRVLKLCAMAERGFLTTRLRMELNQQMDDLNRGIRHWRAKHAAARQKEKEMGALVEDIANRAFQGHYGELV